ncbi:MAG: hypothetical protein JOZ94_21685 [Xanthobacteraceae bacterium]|nr:hypothetical protein [Xanthobacteraceae bacterium]
MLKWLKKFALEIAPPVTATVLGAFVVHQLWPSGDSSPKPAATPAVAVTPAESAKPANVPAAETSTTAAAPTTVPSPAPVTSKTGKFGRPANEVAKAAPREETPAPRGESEASVLDRAEKALASIPPAKPAGPSLPTRGAPAAPPPAVTMRDPQPTAVTAPVPAPAPPQVTTAAVAPTEPPPMDPPREIAAPAAPVAAPPATLLPPQNQQAQTKNHNPLRVSHTDRENLADIPLDDVPADQAPPAAHADAAPPPPEKPKNIIENIFAPLQAVLPERMRN